MIDLTSPRLTAPSIPFPGTTSSLNQIQNLPGSFKELFICTMYKTIPLETLASPYAFLGLLLHYSFSYIIFDSETSYSHLLGTLDTQPLLQPYPLFFLFCQAAILSGPFLLFLKSLLLLEYPKKERTLLYFHSYS